MYTKNAMNLLKICFAPMDINEFDKMREYKEVYHQLDAANVYIIAKRTMPLMKVIKVLNKKVITLEVSTPDLTKKCLIHISAEENSHLFPNGFEDCTIVTMFQNSVIKNDYARSLQIIFKTDDNEIEAICCTLDQLICFDYNREMFIEVEGDLSPFITYEVLYVGQCTGEHIYKRFRTHHALLDILIKERIDTHGYDKVHDIVILPFRIQSDFFTSIGYQCTKEERTNFVNRIISKDEPVNKKTVSLDCEKALIHALNPKYNKTKFKKYPVSDDGIYGNDFNRYIFSIDERLSLLYSDNQILYGNFYGKTSVISIDDESEFNIVELEAPNWRTIF